MFEIFEIDTGEVIRIVNTEQRAKEWIKNWIDLDYRLAEDRWPEYESVMDMEAAQ